MSNNEDTLETTQRADVPNFLTHTKFDDLNLPESILSGIKKTGFTYCTPIQAQSLPISLTGKDLAGQAQTGTGKTAAFMVTVFSRILSLPKGKPNQASALIIAPTRELALQIHEDAKSIGRDTGLKMTLVVGGIDYQKQADILRQGTDVVICTPGRIIDYIKQSIFKTDSIKIVVIDEADRLFDLGFTKDMRYILKRLPHYDKRQTMLFSATLSYRVLALTYDYMNLPEFISVTPEDISVEGIDQSLYHVGKKEKVSLLLGLLDKEEWDRVLIFVNTKAGVEWLSKKLKGNKLPAEGITGDLPQRKRLRLMERFKDGNLKILVATDVASRGIHVENITHAINYDLPLDQENYLHRIGRTGRAGKKGRAISLACEEYVYQLEAIEDMLGYKITVVWPEDELFKEDKAGHIRIERPKHMGRSTSGRPAPGKPASGRPVPGRPAPERPTPGREHQKAQKSINYPRSANGSIGFSSEPGGIFGLAPDPKSDHPASSQEPSPHKQSRKRSGRRGPRKKSESSQPNNKEKIETSRPDKKKTEPSKAAEKKTKMSRPDKKKTESSKAAEKKTKMSRPDKKKAEASKAAE
ncbi:MAG: DEAD/DEAH box helicase [Deltaproteobacteria bacterium]|nr:DEAD/DEAH box helicase [Deltaproteobacteria bacterium]